MKEEMMMAWSKSKPVSQRSQSNVPEARYVIVCRIDDKQALVTTKYTSRPVEIGHHFPAVGIRKASTVIACAPLDLDIVRSSGDSYATKAVFGEYPGYSPAWQQLWQNA